MGWSGMEWDGVEEDGLETRNIVMRGKASITCTGRAGHVIRVRE